MGDDPQSGSRPGRDIGERLGPAIPVVDSRDLLKGGNELVIRHAGDTYRLRLTRQNRLILNK